MAWEQTASPFPLPLVCGGLWGNADHHGEPRTCSPLGAPPATSRDHSFILPSQSAGEAPRAAVPRGALAGLQVIFGTGEDPGEGKPGWEDGAQLKNPLPQSC